MQEKDRATKLAKAIEEMVQGHMPEDLDDDELEELLQIAKIRLDVAQLASEASTEAQDEVLKRLLARLDSLQKHDDGEPNGVAAVAEGSEEITPDDEGPETLDVKELQDIIGLRRQMAEHAAAISETHRETVWQRVQARIQAEQSEKRGLFRWPFRRRDREADEFGAALDRMVLGEPIWEAKDSQLDGLLRVARARHAAAAMTDVGFADQQARVWSYLRPRIMARLGTPRSRVFERRMGPQWPKYAIAGAAVALVLAALAPLPATGLAHHPITELARFVRGHSAVTETSAPPVVPPVTEVIQASEISTVEAGDRMGLPVFEPTFLPDGYEKASARYFPEPITADTGGVFVLAYEESGLAAEAEEILIYQERASSKGIAVEQGFAYDISLFETGVPATYISGSWQPLASELAWDENGAQTVVFDHEGLRTVVYVSDGDVLMGNVVAIADSLAQQAVSPTN